MEILVQEFIHGIKVKVRKQCALRISQKSLHMAQEPRCRNCPKKLRTIFFLREIQSKAKALFLPDEGSVILIIPVARKDEYRTKLKSLKEPLDIDGVQLPTLEVEMKQGKGPELKREIPEYRQGIVKWSGDDELHRVKIFLKEVTGLDLNFIRSARPLTMDVYENDFTRKDPILQDNNSRITDFAFNKDEAFYIKIRRSRNVSIDRLQLLLGPGIDTENLTLNGLIVSDLGVDNSSGGGFGV